MGFADDGQAYYIYEMRGIRGFESC